jgi:hypothetical protein
MMMAGDEATSSKNDVNIVYVSFRRDMLNYRAMGHSFFIKSGFDYSFDMDRRTFGSIRH